MEESDFDSMDIDHLDRLFDSNREEAMKWWNNIKSKNKKQLLCQNYRFSNGLQNIFWQSLTGREIEEIYNKIK